MGRVAFNSSAHLQPQAAGPPMSGLAVQIWSAMSQGNYCAAREFGLREVHLKFAARLP